MGQKLSSLVFNGPRAKTKTVLEMAYKMDPKSSIIQSVSACWCRLSLANDGDDHKDDEDDYDDEDDLGSDEEIILNTDIMVAGEDELEDLAVMARWDTSETTQF